jgi:hypothetical protein
MQKVCSECGKYLGEAEGPPHLVTHGLCPRCFQRAVEELDNFPDLTKKENGNTPPLTH